MIKATRVALLLCAAYLMYSHETISASGVEAKVSATVSCSVGQLVSISNSETNGTVIKEVQQNIELFTLGNRELTALTLTAVTYPNPAKDDVVLPLTNFKLKDLSCVLYDLQGCALGKGRLQQEVTQIPMQHLEGAAYLL